MATQPHSSQSASATARVVISAQVNNSVFSIAVSIGELHVKWPPRLTVALGLAVALAWLTPSSAQAVNKCTGADGKVTYQDALCNSSGSAEKLKYLGSQASNDHAGRVKKMLAQCEAFIRNVPGWKDKYSLQIDSLQRGQFTTLVRDGKTIAVVAYTASVNGKNSYGGYVGAKPAVCYVDAGETRVIDVVVL